MNPVIKLMNRKDIDTGLSIIKKFLPDQESPYLKYYDQYKDYYLGCFIEDKLIGLIFGLPLWEMDPMQDQHFLIDGIAFLDEYRSFGYGSTLIKEFEDRVFSSQDLPRIGLGTMGRAENFYQKNGYSLYGYISFLNPSEFDESDFVRHPLYQRYRIEGDNCIIYLGANTPDDECRKRLLKELPIDELVPLYEKVKT